MPIEFTCPQCEQPYRVPDDRAGEGAVCRTCAGDMTVPGSAPPVPAFPTIVAPSSGDTADVEAVVRHVETHLGPIERAYRDRTAASIDLHVVRPTTERPWTTLVTTGCSERPMPVPDDLDLPTHCELLLRLAPDWPLTEAGPNDEVHGWPLQLLRVLAGLPREHGTWIGPWQTIPNGEPEQPYAAGTTFSAALLMPPLESADFTPLVVGPTKRIAFYQVLPLYSEETRLVRDAGTQMLVDRLSSRGVPPIVANDRPNVAKKRFGWF